MIDSLNFLGYIDLYNTNPYKRGWDRIKPIKELFHVSPSLPDIKPLNPYI